jgi:intein/homing endonuclease
MKHCANNGQSAGKNFAYILGVYMGDGYIYQRGESYSFGIEVIDLDFIQRVQRELEELIGYKPNINEREDRKGMYRLVCSDLIFKKIKEDTGNKNMFPEYVWNWTKEEQIEFISGLMDSEGWISKRTNPNGNRHWQMGFTAKSSWTYDLHKMINQIGIQTCDPYISKMKNGPMISFTIKCESWGKSNIKFTIKRKQDKVDEYMQRLSSTTRRSNQ